jgi:23S rRNA maturation-related 3'-5' exoribonuclease YhaM
MLNLLAVVHMIFTPVITTEHTRTELVVRPSAVKAAVEVKYDHKVSVMTRISLTRYDVRGKIYVTLSF